MKSPAFVQKMFREYYSRDLSLEKYLRMMEKREFGFASFEARMLRHKSFKNEGELRFFLRDLVPKDAYFSCAYYEEPENEMERKGWLGADLVFDIDSDHIPTSCDRVHDEWVCNVCNFTGKGIEPEQCPACGSEKFHVDTWPCEECLDSAKRETSKLLNMLVLDFGFSEKEISLFFSGHRGYHIHVESDTVSGLDTVARKEIVDYVSASGISLAFHGFGEEDLKNAVASGKLNISSSGWNMRIAEGIQDFLNNARKDYYSQITQGKKAIDAIMVAREKILKTSKNKGSPFVHTRGVGLQTWMKIAEFSSKLKSVNLDTVVTTDIHRLIRMPKTLHGKTAMMKVEFPLSHLEEFDPFRSAIAFKKGTVSVRVSSSPQLKIGEETFGPFKNEKIELPIGVALFLICRDRAEVVQ